MALVSYSDSEGSDSGSASTTQLFEKKKAAGPTALSSSRESSKPTFQPLTDRRNPGKILVSLPDADEHARCNAQQNGSDDNDGDGPARKRPRISAQGGGGGAFSGFNSFLPAPKRKGPVKPGLDKRSDGTAAPRKVFSLKTGAEPGFDRQADEQMKWDLDNGGLPGTTGEETKAGVADGYSIGVTEPVKEKVEEPAVKPKGNAMMFKPLSVARGTTKKKKVRTTVVPPPQTTSSADGGKPVHETMTTAGQMKVGDTISKPAPKPKISLFGLGKEEEQAPSALPSSSAPYIPLVYNTSSEPQHDTSTIIPSESSSPPPSARVPEQQRQQPQTLASIADDLNLTAAQKRQLLGRQGVSSSASNAAGATQSNPNIITFNTDQEYSSNNAFLLTASEVELAAQQHNPVRSIAPGKHSLQQLVNAVSTQREALEESFAAGRRNKREAGNKYGW
ncbi:uncharacterized protein BDCG_02585 [Blastomyces dermatitidis ER-3]|uniref:Mitotic checkpoint regulator, MAD2B-interacting-domain-containing protein n=2 Tax=Ajellomyces dermatitidis TaxID=5039 RepID=F2T3E7_AJEDA|nr:uncharacterized protein BDCG_02585 [Blastomyces dermatitidis ER-3]EEQ87465.1 hypothetical protein BDCG_02585 [Blastomyces dermatitidis ER-3]EGE77949.1 hypothetical protein BDDG_00886 [Blastomyces dermatitidis ATCC 18188]EQL38245.1 hypothetical protein BDFG_00613 [Blastomyces dermatitidis ATCC 26199]